jgi:hypothetical protein
MSSPVSVFSFLPYFLSFLWDWGLRYLTSQYLAGPNLPLVLYNVFIGFWSEIPIPLIRKANDNHILLKLERIESFAAYKISELMENIFNSTTFKIPILLLVATFG